MLVEHKVATIEIAQGRTADVVQVQDERPGRALCDELVDDAGHAVEGRSQDSRVRRLAVPHARIVGCDDMKPIRQKTMVALDGSLASR